MKNSNQPLKLDPELLLILACPDHLSFDLLERESKLVCQVCGQIFRILYQDGYAIPNMMKTDPGASWTPGERTNNSQVISFFQGRSLVSIDNPYSPEVVLDLGCGNNPRGTYNVDCYIPQKLTRPFILADVHKLPFKAKSVDAVISYYNIEHLINPSAFIIKAVELASKQVTIVTDNSDWIGDVFFRIIGKGRIYHDEHYFKWSREYMDNLIRRLGFSNSEVVTANLSTSTIVKLFSIFSFLPRVGAWFHRDLVVRIVLTKI